MIKKLFEDDWIIAVDKPPRVHSVPDGNDPKAESLVQLIQKDYPTKEYTPYVLHRLDYETSGVVLLGKYEHDREILTTILRNESTKKTYTALTKNVPEPRNGNIFKKLPSRYTGTLVEAHTAYNVTRIFPKGEFSIIEATISTGRKHQIRRHLAAIGCPVIMDDLYGDKKFNQKFRKIVRLGRQFLHASRIDFTHPFTQKKTHVRSPLPMDLLVTIKRISGTMPAPRTRPSRY
ncbi:RluA family pseudouridine synthase [Candidatus Gracilibacteria bacterium]|nr:RluA family pseudouridine synthase [Candidatus Gracilibacteria bacterium]